MKRVRQGRQGAARPAHAPLLSQGRGDGPDLGWELFTGWLPPASARPPSLSFQAEHRPHLRGRDAKWSSKQLN